jgi:hypothetical protein
VRFAVAAAATIAVLVVAMAPALLARPGGLFQNVVAFPLGLTRKQTPAASPLPGHLLASLGPGGKLAAIIALAVAGLAVAASLVLRPPADGRAATWRLALGLSLMFALAPATRFGYFAYPAGLLVWLALTRLPRSSLALSDALPATAAGPAAANGYHPGRIAGGLTRASSSGAGRPDHDAQGGSQPICPHPMQSPASVSTRPCEQELPRR